MGVSAGVVGMWLALFVVPFRRERVSTVRGGLEVLLANFFDEVLANRNIDFQECVLALRGDVLFCRPPNSSATATDESALLCRAGITGGWRTNGASPDLASGRKKRWRRQVGIPWKWLPKGLALLGRIM